jgi:hypothetical protein
MSRYAWVPTLFLSALAAAACGDDADDGVDPTDGGVTNDGDQPDPPDGGPSTSDANVTPACVIAACADGIARTCDADPVIMKCADFGASCAEFIDEATGAAFGWCDCGTLADQQGTCSAGRLGIACDSGLGLLAECIPGTRCFEAAGEPFGLACGCDDVPDEICPDAACTGDPDCGACTPDCSDRDCGPNDCGGSCGECGLGASCSPEGRCESVCVPDCAGRDCGDDGCDDECGECAEGQTCSEAGTCEGACTPDCGGRDCGVSCGTSCGTCSDGLECTPDGSCDCDFFATIDYTIDASGLDWDALFGVVVEFEHIALDGTASELRSACLGDPPCGEALSITARFFGCEPRLRIRRTYHVQFGGSCEAEEEVVVGETTIVIPPPIIDGSDCTAPPL